MLHPDDTVQVRRISMLTPPGRPLEVGWAQEFGRWLWHLFVLPAESARPWPLWAHRYIKPPLISLAAQLGVSNPRSLRSWTLHLLLIDPPRGQWSNETAYLRARLRRPPLLTTLMQHVAAPYVRPIVYGIAARIE